MAVATQESNIHLHHVKAPEPIVVVISNIEPLILLQLVEVFKFGIRETIGLDASYMMVYGTSLSGQSSWSYRMVITNTQRLIPRLQLVVFQFSIREVIRLDASYMPV